MKLLQLSLIALIALSCNTNTLASNEGWEQPMQALFTARFPAVRAAGEALTNEYHPIAGKIEAYRTLVLFISAAFMTLAPIYATTGDIRSLVDTDPRALADLDDLRDAWRNQLCRALEGLRSIVMDGGEGNDLIDMLNKLYYPLLTHIIPEYLTVDALPLPGLAARAA